MTEQNEGWPDWRDDGRMVAMRLDDGREVQGKLFYENTYVTEDGEAPLWMVRLSDGGSIPFTENESWRFINILPPANR